MHIKQLIMRQFRCFKELTLSFQHKLVLIEGNNGAGKTSILEALHYLCYLKSFRTHLPRELVAIEQNSFFLGATVAHSDGLEHELEVGFVEQRRALRLDDRSLSSYKELMSHYRIITLTEDDLDLIKSGPDLRRSFIDQYIFLHDPAYLQTIKKYEQIVRQKNALLHRSSVAPEEWRVWTERLWQISSAMAAERAHKLQQLQKESNTLLTTYFPGLGELKITYRPKKEYCDSFEAFLEMYPDLMGQELMLQRTGFGAHLDDFALEFQQKQSRSYASRGQQKLIVLLLKIAQIRELIAQQGPSVFLLDDFMTDFDDQRLNCLLPLLQSLGCQLIFTSPLCQSPLKNALLTQGAQLISLSGDSDRQEPS